MALRLLFIPSNAVVKKTNELLFFLLVLLGLLSFLALCFTRIGDCGLVISCCLSSHFNSSGETTKKNFLLFLSTAAS